MTVSKPSCIDMERTAYSRMHIVDSSIDNADLDTLTEDASLMQVKYISQMMARVVGRVCIIAEHIGEVKGF